VTPEMRSLLDGGWREVFTASLERTWTPAHLGLEQLIKHALALASRQAHERHLVYLYFVGIATPVRRSMQQPFTRAS
jgi:hypothetical protein